MVREKILLIQLFSYGDCLFATAIARQIKHDFPNCELTWAIAPFCSSILINNPYIDNIWCVDYITDKSIRTFSAHKKQLFNDAHKAGFNKIFFSQIIEDNYSYYDGLVRSSLYNAFGRKITAGIQPVLRPTNAEQKKVEDYISTCNFPNDAFLILFECTPLSGQLKLTIDKAFQLSAQIIQTNPNVYVILSSQQSSKIKNERIIDGSPLTLRETAYLTKFCNLLIGCSSGITWASTADGAKQLPSVQLLDKHAYIFNSPVLDHERFGISTERWLELYEFDDSVFLNCIQTVINEGFAEAKKKFNQSSGMTFRIYRGIVYSFLKKMKYNRLLFFLKHNLRLYHFNTRMLLSMLLGFVLFPLQLLAEIFKKNK
jgi:ADP-heptose:LPS heptosyltransferase